MAVFLSYAHQDSERVEPLGQDLGDLDGQIWLDRSLVGGQAWWEEILTQIRSCSLFVLAVSKQSLESEACHAELGYALAVGRPLLAVRIDDTDLAAAPDSIRDRQLVDYRTRDIGSIKALARAVGLAGEPGELPAVLPEHPPIPRSYADRFRELFAPVST